MDNQEEKDVNNINNSKADANTNINDVFKSKLKKEKIKKIIKRIVIVGLIVGFFAYIKLNAPQQEIKEEFNFDEHVVEYGDIKVLVEGDGVITANSIYNIVPKVTGEILQDNVVANSYVNKGDLLYVIDSKDINNSINQAGLGIQQSNVAVNQAQTNYNTIKDQINDLKIYATADGYIQNLKIDEGSLVNQMMPVCDINELNVYEVTLQYRTATAKNVKIGDKVKLFYLDFIEYIDGVVTKINDSTNLISMGAQVTEVTIQVTTAGYSLQNARVEGTIYLSDGTQIVSVNNAYLSAKSANVVVSQSTGTVKKLYVDNGSYVHTGDLIAELDNSSLNTQLKNAQLSIENANLSKKNAQNSYSQVSKQLDNYHITSPISGKIVFKSAKKGDVISQYQQNATNILAIVADVSTMKFEMQIDELDIKKIQIGQDVTVTIEALENKEFMGKVSNINIIGVNAAGTTNYTVEIEIPGTDEIYSGMTVDAKINVAEKHNVLRIPLTAVRKGNIVYKKSNNPEFQDEDTRVPKGYEKVVVEVGLNSEEYIEVTSGLSSGDTILTDKVMESGTFSMENLANMMREN